MKYAQAKHIALKLANQYQLELPFEDRVQECLLCWVELKERDVPNSYIFISMRNRLIDISRNERARQIIRTDQEVIDTRETPQEYLIRQEERKVIAIPARTRVVRRFVRLMLENDLNLEKSCNTAGISYTRGVSWWRRGKRIIKQMAEKGWTEEDVIATV